MVGTAPDYEIRIHRRFDEVPRAAWDRLHADSPDATIFQHYAWARSWWSSSAPQGAELCIVAASRHGCVCAIAPLYLQRPIADSERSQLRFLGGFHNDYQVYLVHPDHADVYGDIHRYLRMHLPADEIVLNEVPRHSALNAWLAGTCPRAVRLDSTPCPMLCLDLETDIDAFVNKRSVRRKQTKLNGLGTLAVEHVRDKVEIQAGLAALFDQHVRRWEHTDSPSLFRHERNRTFYRCVVDALPDGTAVFTRLRLGERVIACHLGFVSGADLLWYKPAFDIEYARYSPGELMITALIQHARDAGYRSLDFTRGAEAFKQRFSNRINWNDNYVLYRSITRFVVRSADRALRRSYRRARELALRPTRLQQRRLA
jgi:CelD/BcsL family acetyltransferase involved in cellulose biosynthesis